MLVLCPVPSLRPTQLDTKTGWLFCFILYNSFVVQISLAWTPEETAREFIWIKSDIDLAEKIQLTAVWACLRHVCLSFTPMCSVLHTSTVSAVLRVRWGCFLCQRVVTIFPTASCVFRDPPPVQGVSSADVARDVGLGVDSTLPAGYRE